MLTEGHACAIAGTDDPVRLTEGSRVRGDGIEGGRGAVDVSQVQQDEPQPVGRRVAVRVVEAGHDDGAAGRDGRPGGQAEDVLVEPDNRAVPDADGRGGRPGGINGANPGIAYQQVKHMIKGATARLGPNAPGPGRLVGHSLGAVGSLPNAPGPFMIRKDSTLPAESNLRRNRLTTEDLVRASGAPMRTPRSRPG